MLLMLFHQPKSSFIKEKLISQRFFSTNRRTSPSNSQEFRPVILDQRGHVRPAAPGTPVCWASPWPPQGRAALALCFAAGGQECGARTPTLHPCQVSIMRSLQVFIHLRCCCCCCCSHLPPQPATSKMAAASFLVAACCLESSGPRRDLVPSVMLLICSLGNRFSRGFLSCGRKTAS